MSYDTTAFDDDSPTVRDPLGDFKMRGLMEHEQAVREACELRGEVIELQQQIDDADAERRRITRCADDSRKILIGAQVKLNEGKIISAFDDMDTVVDVLTEIGDLNPIDKIVVDVKDFVPARKVQ